MPTFFQRPENALKRANGEFRVRIHSFIHDFIGRSHATSIHTSPAGMPVQF